jgi:hypothetical protein
MLGTRNKFDVVVRIRIADGNEMVTLGNCQSERYMDAPLVTISGATER